MIWVIVWFILSLTFAVLAAKRQDDNDMGMLAAVVWFLMWPIYAPLYLVGRLALTIAHKVPRKHKLTPEELTALSPAITWVEDIR